MLYCIGTIVCYVCSFEWQIKFSLSPFQFIHQTCEASRCAVLEKNIGGTIPQKEAAKAPSDERQKRENRGAEWFGVWGVLSLDW